MTERDPRPAEGLTPAQAEAVRRLLAGARHDEGIPGDVAARLDSAIADLAAERASGVPAVHEAPADHDAVVIPLRRRRWPQVLVAAAAVTVFGFGMAQIVGNGADDADNSGGGTVVAPEAATSEDLGDNGAVASGPPESAPQTPQNGRTSLTYSFDRLGQRSLSELGIAGLRVLRPGTLDRDLRALIPPGQEANTDTTRGDSWAEAVRCGPYYSVSGGETFAASYRRHLALVLFHPALDGARLVEIYDCEGANPRQTVRTVTLQTGE